jgi:hypothetical protein
MNNIDRRFAIPICEFELVFTLIVCLHYKLSIVIVRVCGRSSNRRTSVLAGPTPIFRVGLLDAPHEAGHDNRRVEIQA